MRSGFLRREKKEKVGKEERGEKKVVAMCYTSRLTKVENLVLNFLKRFTIVSYLVYTASYLVYTASLSTQN